MEWFGSRIRHDPASRLHLTEQAPRQYAAMSRLQASIELQLCRTEGSNRAVAVPPGHRRAD